MKITRTTLIMLAVFAIALVVTWVTQWSPLKQTRQTSTPTSIPYLITGINNIAQMASVEITSNQGVGVSLRRSADSTWAFTDLEGKPADQGKVTDLLASLLILKPTGTVELSITLDELGLASPTQTITIISINNERKVIRIGNLTPISTGYYVQVDNNPPVVVVKDSIDTLLTKFTKGYLVLATSTPMAQDTQLTPTLVITNQTTPAGTEVTPTLSPTPLLTPTPMAVTPTS